MREIEKIDVSEALMRALRDKRETLRDLERMNVPKDTNLWKFNKQDEDKLIIAIEIIKKEQTEIDRQCAFSDVIGGMLND